MSTSSGQDFCKTRSVIGQLTKRGYNVRMFLSIRGVQTAQRERERERNELLISDNSGRSDIPKRFRVTQKKSAKG